MYRYLCTVGLQTDGRALTYGLTDNIPPITVLYILYDNVLIHSFLLPTFLLKKVKSGQEKQDDVFENGTKLVKNN